MYKEIFNMLKEMIISKKIQSYIILNLGILTIIFKINSNLILEGLKSIENLLPASFASLVQIFVNNIGVLISILSYVLLISIVFLLIILMLLKLGESLERINIDFLKSIINFLGENIITISNITLILNMINIINTNKIYSGVGEISFFMIVSVYSIAFINYIFSR